jgi:hypothetical protein
MRSYVPVILCLTGLLASACASSPRATDGTQSSFLTGTWQWISSSGGKMGHTLTPEDTSYRISVQFQADSTFTFYKDGLMLVRGRFDVTQDKQIVVVSYNIEERSDATSVFSWASRGAPPQHTIQFNDNGTIILDEGCCDRYRHTLKQAE